jgi:hypothetical protein
MKHHVEFTTDANLGKKAVGKVYTLFSMSLTSCKTFTRKLWNVSMTFQKAVMKNDIYDYGKVKQ